MVNPRIMVPPYLLRYSEYSKIYGKELPHSQKSILELHTGGTFRIAQGGVIKSHKVFTTPSRSFAKSSQSLRTPPSLCARKAIAREGEHRFHSTLHKCFWATLLTHELLSNSVFWRRGAAKPRGGPVRRLCGDVAKLCEDFVKLCEDFANNG